MRKYTVRSLAHSFTHSVRSLAHSFTHSVRSLAHSFTHSVRSLAHFVRSLTLASLASGFYALIKYIYNI